MGARRGAPRGCPIGGAESAPGWAGTRPAPTGWRRSRFRVPDRLIGAVAFEPGAERGPEVAGKPPPPLARRPLLTLSPALAAALAATGRSLKLPS